MGLVWAGLVVFLAGVGLIVAGDVLRRRQPAARGGPADSFFEWFGGVVKQAFTVLTSATAGPGEKVSAAGTIVAGAGVLMMVVGLVGQLG